MPNKPERLIWSEGLWRWEYRQADGGHGDLRLYDGAAIMRSARVTGGAVVLAVASDWRTIVLRGTVPPS